MSGASSRFVSNPFFLHFLKFLLAKRSTTSKDVPDHLFVDFEFYLAKKQVIIVKYCPFLLHTSI